MRRAEGVAPRDASARRLLACVLLAGAALQAPSPSHAQPTAAITMGTVDSIRSSTLGEWRRFLVYTPPSYREPSRFSRRYPVLYLLDGEVYFASVASLVQLLGTGVNGTWAIPELIVVAIPIANRRRDLTPTRITRDPYGRALPSGWDVTGGNPRFLDFLEGELIPRIDSAYRTAPWRAYIGHSLGGLAVLNALYTRAELFNAYVAIDPTLWMDDHLLVRQAREVFRRPAPPGRALFIAQGNNITPYDTGTAINHNAILQLQSVIQAENTSGIRHGYRYYDREDHGSIPYIAQYDGLRFVFEGFYAHVPRAASHPGYLTEHFEGLSKQWGYRVIPPDGLARFAGMLSTTEPQGLAAPRDALTNMMGTWVRDSATGPGDTATPNGETLVLTAESGGFRVEERSGGPAGPTILSMLCRRSAATVTAVPAEWARVCHVQVAGDSVLYTIYAKQRGKVAAVERGVVSTSSEARVLRDEFTSVRANGAIERRRHIYSRLY